MQKHVVIIGGGFAGLSTAKNLRKKGFKVTLIEKNNYSQFSPLFYQVAAAQIESSSIVFPLRKEIKPSFLQHFLMAEVLEIVPEENTVKTTEGDICYDYLVVAAGTMPNYFGMKDVEQHAFPLKNLSHAMILRNKILETLEKAANCKDQERRKQLLCIAIIGGGPTGVEVAGALAAMKKYIVKKDYPEINPEDFRILLIDGGTKLIAAMSPQSSKHAKKYLEASGVEIILEKNLKAYDGTTITLSDGSTIKSTIVVWSSGVTAQTIKGLDNPNLLSKGNRIKVNNINQIEGFDNIFAIGDICIQFEKDYPNGHPQLAQTAMQQGLNLAENLSILQTNKQTHSFKYKDKGSMAIIGKNKAVADIHKLHFGGFTAWLLWLFIHLISIIGFKNKLLVLLDWSFYYFWHNSSLGLILKGDNKKAN